jgi:hypothetical protein
MACKFNALHKLKRCLKRGRTQELNWVTSQARPSADPLCDTPRGLIGDLYDTPQTWMFCEWRLMVRFFRLPPQARHAAVCCLYISKVIKLTIFKLESDCTQIERVDFAIVKTTDPCERMHRTLVLLCCNAGLR